MNKSLWTGLGACTAMLILIIDGKTALEGAAQGIDLCLKTVVPSLFPFFVLSNLLTNSFADANIPFLRFGGKLLRIPKGCESILIPAFLGGYPAGAQSVRDACYTGKVTRENAEYILSYCNNAGPSFLFGMVSSLFPQKRTVWVLWFIQILSAFVTAQFFPISPQAVSPFSRRKDTISSILHSAIRITAHVCGWIILFRIVICFLNRWFLWLFPTPVRVVISGLLELSNGCWELKQLENVSLRFIICSGILAFGGICITLQTMSAANGLSLRWYFHGKLIQTICCLLFAVLIVLDIGYVIPFLIILFLLFSRKKKNSSGNPQMIRV